MPTTEQLVSFDSIAGSRHAICARLSASNSNYPSGHPQKPATWQCMSLMVMLRGLCGAISACSASNPTPTSQSAKSAATARFASVAVPQAGTSFSSINQALKKEIVMTSPEI